MFSVPKMFLDKSYWTTVLHVAGSIPEQNKFLYDLQVDFPGPMLVYYMHPQYRSYPSVWGKKFNNICI